MRPEILDGLRGEDDLHRFIFFPRMRARASSRGTPRPSSSDFIAFRIPRFWSWVRGGGVSRLSRTYFPGGTFLSSLGSRFPSQVIKAFLTAPILSDSWIRGYYSRTETQG